jgi:hypothetical protein
MKLTAKTLKQFARLLKATTIGDTPFGRGASGHIAQPFLPDPLAATFIDIVTEYNNFRGVFRSMSMASRVRTIPKLLTGTKVYYQPSEATAGQETTWSAGSIEMVAKKLFAWIEISEETFEDGIIDMRTMIRGLFARGMGEWEEKAFLTGDVGHTPVTANEALGEDDYDGTWFNRDARLAYDGLLTIGLEDGVQQAVNGNCTVDVFRQGIYRLGRFGRQQPRLFTFLNPYSANQLLADDDLRTVDKYGPKATVLTGEIGELFNKWKVVQTDYIPEGYGVTTHRDNVIIGDRRRIKFAEDAIIKNDTVVWAISERVAMEVEYDEAVLVFTGLNKFSAS